MTVVTRFAPAPTGLLHIGNARTALFNWLFAKHHQGTYLLRIEDTDRARSTQEAIDVILDGLSWLDLTPDQPPVFQSKNAPRHQEIAEQLLSTGHAYYCTCSPETLEARRAEARAQGLPLGYSGHCREHGHTKGVLRLKLPKEGTTDIDDLIQGNVTVQNKQLDDFVILRADGTPTYMLSVVVDDHDMGVTHVLRGDDHLTNAFRQYHLYKAMNWDIPTFGHIPLIHGEDGAKFSKRHGAPAVHTYREMGYLPAAVCNYLLRLGWSHGDDEFITRAQAIEWFTPKSIQKSPARFDWKKLNHFNGHYLRAMADQDLAHAVTPFIEAALHRPLTNEETACLVRALPGLKQRATTLVDLAQNSVFYFETPQDIDEKGKKILAAATAEVIQLFITSLEEMSSTTWSESGLETHAREFAETHSLALGKLAQPLRVLLTGTTVSPSIFEVMTVFGKDRTLHRLQAMASHLA